jgi:hypothetical protein
MARSLITVERLGSPSATPFEVAVNQALAPLLSNLIGVVDILVTDKLPAYSRQFKAVIDTDSGGTLISTPYKLKVIEGDSDQTAKVLAEEFINANPTWFFAPANYLYSDQLPNVPSRSLIFLFYNEDLANGLLNWQPGYAPGGGGGGGPPTGPAGGDLGGSYPNPTVPAIHEYNSPLAVGINVITSVPAASIGDQLWELELVKGTVRYSTLLRANHDGTIAYYTESEVTVTPGVVDTSLAVALSGGNLQLQVTAPTPGWAIRYRTRTLAA